MPNTIIAPAIADNRIVPTLPVPVAEIAAALACAGHRALLVGGCVRDMEMGREPKDYDIATSATPEQTLALFPGAQPVGAHFGVVLFRGVEIATFRSEGPYADGRRPSWVRYVEDPALDAARRDFTINGLFLDPSTGEILDFVGGRADIAKGIVRAIGSPTARISEDYLRLLRGVRFAARFRFELDAATAAAIRESAGLVRAVAVERVRDELSRILTEGGARYGFELLDALRLLPQLLPEVDDMHGVEQPPEYHPEGDVWVHTLLMLEGLVQPSVTLAWGVLLHDVAKPPTFRIADRIRFDGHAELGARMAVDILGRLRYPNAVVERVRELVAQHLRFSDAQKMRPATRKRFLRQELFPELLELHRLDCLSSHRRLGNYEFCREQLAELSAEQLRHAPLLTGRDLLALGIPAGPAMGRLLRLIEDRQLEGEISTRDQALALALNPPASEQSST
jgi:tRNA nucleotidyltransferase/poly(A) polymerase